MGRDDQLVGREATQGVLDGLTGVRVADGAGDLDPRRREALDSYREALLGGPGSRVVYPRRGASGAC